MFNEKSVGTRVISKTEGIGTISKYTTQEGDFAAYITVIFESARFYNYFLSGKMLGFADNKDEDLLYLHIKQGSQDARRIVAMLALEYRKYTHKVNRLSKESGRYDFLHGCECYAAKAYQQAKQLLKEQQ